ncbi:hypothetical protein EVAR_67989_1 [Eumeta japonica]|uniref:Calphotin-like n=1 Tax=Eumeta variegata TaxID=151549 RepID=A0A4C1ZQY0_EUMVA|nr:hypothetical protein EVAR_67989_1 [Eumeta japonica]
MKFLAVFALFVCAAYGAAVPVAPAIATEWTQAELSQALMDPATDPALLPYLEHAFNQMMYALWNGTPMQTIVVSIPMDLLLKPEPEVAAPVEVAPAPAIATEWTQAELSEALNDPATDPALLPYLEHAFNQMMDALWAGNPMESITVSIPMDLLLKPEPEVPAAPVEAPVAPVEAAPAAPAAPTASAPLVQIILNINQQSQDSPIAVSPAVIPEAAPEQVQVVEDAVNHETVNVVEEAVNVVEDAFEEVSIDKPILDINPIDVIAVSPAEINPVDLISPVPVVQPAGAAGGIIV